MLGTNYEISVLSIRCQIGARHQFPTEGISALKMVPGTNFLAPIPEFRFRWFFGLEFRVFML